MIEATPGQAGEPAITDERALAREEQGFASDPISRFGFLVVALILLVWSLWALPHELRSSLRPYRQVLFSLWLVFIHLASASSGLPAGKAKKAMRLLAIAWLALVIAYAYTPLFW